jgi:hypothetical protein
MTRRTPNAPKANPTSLLLLDLQQKLDMQVSGYTGLYLLEGAGEVSGEVVIVKLLADMLLLIDGRQMSERL